MQQPSPEFLNPVTLAEFFENYWEKKPLHISRRARDTTPYIDLDSIEQLLSTQPVFFPGVQVTQQGRTIDAGSYSDDQSRILPLRLFEQYSQGATIVLSQAQKLIPALHDLCREAVRTLGMRCQTNVYVSPPGNQGFNAHYDTHDVFILQMSGAKTFNFYPSAVELPFPEESFDAARLNTLKVDESIDLLPGDTLYIPRGVVHDAVADANAPSIHVTLGVYPVVLRDVLQEMVQQLAVSDKRFRRSVDAFGKVGFGANLSHLQSALKELLGEMQDHLNDTQLINQVKSTLSDELSLGGLQDCRGLSARLLKSAFDDEGVATFQFIVLRQNVLIDWEPLSNGVRLRCHGQVLTFNHPIADVVQSLLEKGHLPIDAISVLQPDQRDALISRLLQENLIDLTNNVSA